MNQTFCCLSFMNLWVPVTFQYYHSYHKIILGLHGYNNTILSLHGYKPIISCSSKFFMTTSDVWTALYGLSWNIKMPQLYSLTNQKTSFLWIEILTGALSCLVLPCFQQCSCIKYCVAENRCCPLHFVFMAPTKKREELPMKFLTPLSVKSLRMEGLGFQFLQTLCYM